MLEKDWPLQTSPAFRLMIATSWIATAPWESNQFSAIRAVCESGPDWEEYLRLVDRHRIRAVSWEAIRRVPGIAVPERVIQEMKRRSKASRLRAMMHLELLIRVVRAFNQAGIPIMPLKGPLLSLDIFGHPALRESRDLDVLVPSEMLIRAQETLEDLGWHRTAGFGPFSKRQMEILLRHEHNLSYIDPKSCCEVELHWRMHWDTPELSIARIDRAEPRVWQGVSFLGMSASDLLVFLCNHGCQHAWLRAKWLGDVATLCAKHAIDWDTVLSHAHSTGQHRPVILTWRLLANAYGLTLRQPLYNEESVSFPLLARSAMKELTAASSPEDRGVFNRCRAAVARLVRDRRLWAHKTRRATIRSVAFCRADFGLLPIPDSLIILYLPLRPLLWIWRNLGNMCRNAKMWHGRASFD